MPACYLEFAHLGSYFGGADDDWHGCNRGDGASVFFDLFMDFFGFDFFPLISCCSIPIFQGDWAWSLSFADLAGMRRAKSALELCGCPDGFFWPIDGSSQDFEFSDVSFDISLLHSEL